MERLCKNCRYWTAREWGRQTAFDVEESPVKGVCEAVDYTNPFLADLTDAYLGGLDDYCSVEMITGPEFGCTKFEAKG